MIDSAPPCLVDGCRAGVPDDAPLALCEHHLAVAGEIGTSGNPRQRLRALWHDELLAFARGDRRVEGRRHAQFAAERFDATEWFQLSARLRAHIDHVRGGADPWDQYLRWMSESYAVSR